MLELLGRHPDAGVDDDDYVATFEEPAVDVHRGPGGREAEGVLDELGQDVDEVSGDDPGYDGRVEVVQPQAVCSPRPRRRQPGRRPSLGPRCSTAGPGRSRPG